MKTSEFNNFLRLAEEREPVFKDVLASANDMMEDGFQDHLLHTETAMTNPPSLLPSPLSRLNMSDVTKPIMSGLEYTIGAGDACSGPDLDTLLSFSFRQAAEGQQMNDIVSQCNLWPSTRFDYPNDIDELPGWSPRLQRSKRRPRRHQMLPFYNTGRWQLAVFDVVKNVVVCYDTTWTSGSPNSVFLVGQTLCLLRVES